MCGSDGVTYSNRCHFSIAKCHADKARRNSPHAPARTRPRLDIPALVGDDGEGEGASPGLPPASHGSDAELRIVHAGDCRELQ